MTKQEMEIFYFILFNFRGPTNRKLTSFRHIFTLGHYIELTKRTYLIDFDW